VTETLSKVAVSPRVPLLGPTRIYVVVAVAVKLSVIVVAPVPLSLILALVVPAALSPTLNNHPSVALITSAKKQYFSPTIVVISWYPNPYDAPPFSTTSCCEATDSTPPLDVLHPVAPLALLAQRWSQRAGRCGRRRRRRGRFQIMSPAAIDSLRIDNGCRKQR
jgi:hypothetical protein